MTSGGSMRAGVWRGLGEIDCGEWETPRNGPGEVLVDVGVCGFCGTDPHIIDGNFRIGPPPQVLGHEVAGTVVAVGAEVEGFGVGDRVACSPFAYCGACPWCRSDEPNHCRRKRFSANGFAERAVYEPSQLFPLPADMSLEAAAFLEPAATCLRAVEAGAIRAGEHVLVIGAGPLGLMIARLAALAGAATVTVSEPRAANRALALARGADAALDPGEADLRVVARATGDRRGFDVVFEVAGVAAAARLAPELVAARGRVVLVGVFDRDAEIPVRPYLIYEREISIRGVFSTGLAMTRTLALLPKLDVEELITAVEPLERIGDVYRGHRAGAYVKALVAP